MRHTGNYTAQIKNTYTLKTENINLIHHFRFADIDGRIILK